MSTTSQPTEKHELVGTAPGLLEWQTSRIEKVPAGSVLIETHLASLKHGTEMHSIQNTGPFATKVFDQKLRIFMDKTQDQAAKPAFPYAVGIIVIGKVAAAGDGVTSFKVGDLVVARLPVADWHVCKAADVKPLGKLTPEQELMVDPAMFGVGAVMDGNVTEGKRVLFTGLGAIGLSGIQEAVARGATVYASSSIPHRRTLAQSLGAVRVLDSSNNADVGLELKQRDLAEEREAGACGVDVAIECSGKYANLRHAIRATRQCGRVVTVGFYDDGAANINFGEEIFHNCLTILASLPAYRWGNPLRTQPPMYAPELEATVRRYLKNGRVKPDGILTYVKPHDAVAAVTRLTTHPGDIVKLVIDFRATFSK